MSNKGKRVTKQIRVYEDTWRLIDEIIKRTKAYPKSKPTQADVVEQWAREMHPEMYEAVSRSIVEMGKAFPDEIEGYKKPPSE